MGGEAREGGSSRISGFGARISVGLGVVESSRVREWGGRPGAQDSELSTGNRAGELLNVVEDGRMRRIRTGSRADDMRTTCGER